MSDSSLADGSAAETEQSSWTGSDSEFQRAARNALNKMMRKAESSAQLRRTARDALNKMERTAGSARADAIGAVADAVMDGTMQGMSRYESTTLLLQRPLLAKAVEALFVIAHDPEKYAETVLLLVANLGKDAAEVIPTLMAFLGDDDMEISIAAARAITGAGRAAIPALNAALNDPDSNVSHRAETILKRITEDNPEA